MTKSTQSMETVMTIDAACDLAGRLVDMERHGAGDTDGALYRIEQRYGISPNQMAHLAYGRAKTCDIGLFARLRAAYLDLCERQVGKLQHQIAVLKATDGDDDLRDLEAEAAALAEKVAARKARPKD